VSTIRVLTDIGHAVAWQALYAAGFSAVLLALLALTTNVALFAHDDKRAERALKILRELVRLFRRRPR
jgi:hypothetical protein